MSDDQQNLPGQHRKTGCTLVKRQIHKYKMFERAPPVKMIKITMYVLFDSDLTEMENNSNLNKWIVILIIISFYRGIN